MKPYFNFRNLALVALTALMLLVKFTTDPTQGAVTLEFLIYVSTPILVVLIAHWLRKLLFPYVDMGALYERAMKSSVGAGLSFIGMALVLSAIMGLFGPSARAQDVTTYIPQQAKTHLPALVAEQQKYWPNHPKQQPLVV